MFSPSSLAGFVVRRHVGEADKPTLKCVCVCLCVCVCVCVVMGGRLKESKSTRDDERASTET